MTHDAVNHPKHYTAHPSGIECIQVTEHMSFCLGNAVKYIWRADLKNDAFEDLRKAIWYIQRELKRRGAIMPRSYKKEYDSYHSKPEQVKNRMARNRARYKLMKEGKVKKGDGMDVAHVKAIDKGGTNGDGLKVQSRSANRSFKRDSKGNLVSEVSKKERKRA